MSDTRPAADRPVSTAPSPVDPDGGGVEMLRLIQRLFLSNNDQVHRHVVFTGVGRDNGSAPVCAGAARALAAGSARTVCVVDANLRSARLAALMGIDSGRRYTAEGGSCVAIRENLWIAKPGLFADASGVLASASRLRELLSELRARFDFVLIDAPGADVSGDAMILAQVADGTVLVIDAEETRKIAARKVKEVLDAANVRLLGTVLRNRSYPIPTFLYDRL